MGAKSLGWPSWLPEGIGDPKTLQILQVSRNRLSALPRALTLLEDPEPLPTDENNVKGSARPTLWLKATTAEHFLLRRAQSAFQHSDILLGEALVRAD